MFKIVIVSFFGTFLAGSAYFGINAWERWAAKMKARGELKGATAHQIDNYARGLELTSAAKRAAAQDLLAEARGKRKPPGRFAQWIFQSLANG